MTPKPIEIPKWATNYSIIYGYVSFWRYQFWFRGVESGEEFYCWHERDGNSWVPQYRPDLSPIDQFNDDEYFKDRPPTESELESLALIDKLRKEDAERIRKLQEKALKEGADKEPT